MKKILLTQDKAVLVDDEDYEALMEHKWHYNGRAAMRTPWAKGKRPRIYMHQAILGRRPGFVIDHIDGNPLNNTRTNLRFCTVGQNQLNQEPVRGGTSQYKGVHWHKRDRKWRASVSRDGKRHWLGWFDDEIEAAKAYDEGAKRIHGEFARLNFKEDDNE